jgi:hypothetical protein
MDPLFFWTNDRVRKKLVWLLGLRFHFGNALLASFPSICIVALQLLADLVIYSRLVIE